MAVKTAKTATVEPGASVGDRTVIWDESHVRAGATIGCDCVIGRNVFVDAGVVVGDRCKIQNNALVYAPARLGHGVFVGPAAILTNDRFPRAVTPDGSLKSADDWDAIGVTVEDGASIGAGAIVVGGVRIAGWALVAAGAVVPTDVPAFALVAGVPARRIRWVGRAGVPLEGDGDVLECPVTGARYRERDGALEEIA
jgi:acetyltransferase-like isoleucine patch superfamily enzyme